MRRRRVGIALLLLALLAAAPAALAQSRGRSRGGSGSQDGTPAAISPVTINPSPGNANPGKPPWCRPDPSWGPPGLIVVPWGPWFPVEYSPFPPPSFLTANNDWPGMQPPPDRVFEPEFVWPTPPRAQPAPTAIRPRTRDANRVKELIKLGDRLFRAGNLIRASERYEQAVRANVDLAAPRARLAQVALVRGKYRDAANRLREAQTAEPGWLGNPGDLRDIYPEPATYAGHVAKLEAHLQARPEDRDGWLVLGALWYLSGKTQKAADVFLRLSDRREAPTLRAFLQATKAEPAEEP